VTLVLVEGMGVRRIFSRGGQEGIFPKFFPGGAKSSEICFLPLEIEKTTIFANHFKIQEEPRPPALHARMHRNIDAVLDSVEKSTKKSLPQKQPRAENLSRISEANQIFSFILAISK